MRHSIRTTAPQTPQSRAFGAQMRAAGLLAPLGNRGFDAAAPPGDRDDFIRRASAPAPIPPRAPGSPTAAIGGPAPSSPAWVRP